MAFKRIIATIFSSVPIECLLSEVCLYALLLEDSWSGSVVAVRCRYKCLDIKGDSTDGDPSTVSYELLYCMLRGYGVAGRSYLGQIPKYDLEQQNH
ncbi:hypothetical protein AVEN_237765-1 [Araneus ventricosus]|uniref:Uncharacterized protein n=1 Tax=Araneus ventricosus TaxID=182803 RepID=A0A4Y2QPB2_ARAVE|nr:hypothetical protein AVEN_8235-1 [Araneus ventricosus]GBN65159.1 hypothetical protein AVEN_13711-1 [Araneus ventricosus]GBN65746.1 hypothetical protein AVEN_237765-1 [Araneus ventricosus]